MGTPPEADAPQLLRLHFRREEKSDKPFHFQFKAQGYFRETAGGISLPTRFEWSEELLADLRSLNRSGADVSTRRKLGLTMRSFVSAVGWSDCEAQLCQDLTQKRQVTLTIRSSAAELYALPWELLALESGKALSQLDNLLLRYEWPSDLPPKPAAVPPAGEVGRILVAWSTAGGDVPWKEHIQAIAAACGAGQVPFNSGPQGDVVEQASLEKIVERLREAQSAERPIGVLHILCHGGEIDGTFGLALDGAGRPVDADRMQAQLAPFAGMVKLIVLSACHLGNPGKLGNHLGSVAQALHREGFAAVLASRFPLSWDGSILLTRSLYETLLIGPSSLEHAVRAARQRLAAAESAEASPGRGLDSASLQLYARHDDGDDTRPLAFRPYRGLLPFEAAHARFFFGRTAEVNEVMADLQALQTGHKPRLLIVAGASGTGKSSVVLSGVIPRLVRPLDEARGHDPAVEALQSSVDSLETYLRHDGGDGTIAQTREILFRKLSGLRATSGASWQAVVMRPGAQPLLELQTALGKRDGKRRFLLVVDQFEEIFTQTSDPAARQRFARALWESCQDEREITCILTLRVDFLGHCGALLLDDQGLRLDRVAYDEAHRIFVAQLQPDQLRAAIEEPAARVGLELEPDLVDRMLRDVGHEPGALPLLEYTLDQLWQRRDGRRLTHAAYNDIGTVSGALAGAAETLYGGLDAAEQQELRRLMVRLIAPRPDGGLDTRRRVCLRELGPPDPEARERLRRVLEKLVAARLIVQAQERGEATVEVAHEALLRKWERLRTWAQEDSRMLRELKLVEEWAGQWRDYGAILSSSRLAYLDELVARYQAEVSLDARELLEVSHRQAPKVSQPPPDAQEVKGPLRLTFEFVRSENTEDPFAFRLEPQSYIMRQGDGSYVTCSLDWGEEWVSDIDAMRRPGCDPMIPRRIGEKLAAFVDQVRRDAAARILKALRTGRQVYLTIRSGAAELYALPWDLLDLLRTGQPIGQTAGVLISYEWPAIATRPALPLEVETTERVLFAWSAAASAVPAAEYVAAIALAAEGSFLCFDRERDVLSQVSIHRLCEALEQAQRAGSPVAVLHLLGSASIVGSEIGFPFMGDDGNVVVLDQYGLRQLLAPFAHMVRLVVLTMVDPGNTGTAATLAGLAQSLHRIGIEAVVSSRFPLSIMGSIELTRALYHGLLGEATSLEAALLAARESLILEGSNLDWANVQLYKCATGGPDTRPLRPRPYRGVASAGSVGPRFFVGREPEMEELGRRLSFESGTPRLLAVIGPPMVGKTSLLHGLYSQDDLRVVWLCPGREPLASLERALAQAPRDGVPRLVVVDQFEELFSLCQDPAAREAFVQELWKLAVHPMDDSRVVIALRSSFRGQCGELCIDASGTRLSAILSQPRHRVLVAQLAAEQLLRVIEEPARKVGFHLGAGLPTRLIDYVGNRLGGLALLGELLDQLWLRSLAADGPAQVSLSDVVPSALPRWLDWLLHRLEADAQQSVQCLLARLSSQKGGQGIVSVTELRNERLLSPEQLEQALATLTAAQLVRCSGVEGAQTVELDLELARALAQATG